MDKKSSPNIKRKVTAKLILFIVLCAIMVPLILGYIITRGKKPGTDSKPPETTVEQTTEEQTEPVSETTTEPLTEESTVPAETSKVAAGEPVVYLPTDANNWMLSLVSIKYKIPDKYVPQLSAAVTGSTVQLDSRVAAAYQKMYDAAKANGCVLTPYSGYRSVASQESTYNRKVNYYINQGLTKEQAVEKTNQRILPAGCSEHNMGVAMDIVSASSDFMNTKEYKWLLQNAQTYGFVLRYPEDKVQITGVMFEPWHWRYVGEKAAKEMKTKNLCLEEYLLTVQQTKK